MAPALTHIWLLVDDMPRALSFYQDTLGLKLGSNLGEYAEFEIDQHFMLALFERTAMQAGEPGIAISPVSGQHATLAFEVETLDSFCADLRAKGVVFTSEAANHPEWGLRTFFLRDPDGNLICLYSGIPASEATQE
ncbi:MAG TPA: VOC family protein [Ktedonobacterales bacterium]|nr:VOC family protein [Ktedonobacterales bacterium]